MGIDDIRELLGEVPRLRLAAYVRLVGVRVAEIRIDLPEHAGDDVGDGGRFEVRPAALDVDDVSLRESGRVVHVDFGKTACGVRSDVAEDLCLQTAVSARHRVAGVAEIQVQP